ncbi:MAG: protease inhibitor I42 family protein [Halanaerobiales bacterium]
MIKIKSKLLIFLIVFILLLSSYASSNTEKEIEIKKEITPFSIFVIRLKENITTPYKWYYSIDNNKVADIIHDRYIENKKKEDILGAPGHHIWYVFVESEGKSEITFQLKNYNGKIKKTIIYKIDCEKK